MNRETALSRLGSESEPWDVLVVGGGATGLGVAVDAAARGYRTALVEQHDFAKGTSSRSTKLVHGGVRYLRTGEIGLVRGALRERGLLERNAPHVVQRRAFVIPVYRRIDLPMYGFGLKAYEWLSGRLSFGASRILSVKETKECLPTVRTENLRGGVLYYDGQFDDARLAVTLARTASDLGAAVVNYARVQRLLKAAGRVAGAEIVDVETGRELAVSARVVVNATGIFTDAIRRLDDPAVAPMLAVSSGVHLVLDRSFLPGEHALMIPKTSDGRVVFAVPWQDHVLVGTTDVPRSAIELEPTPLESEVQFLIEHAGMYLAKTIRRSDVLAVFTGLRPLVQKGASNATASLSRDHVVEVSPSGLVTITGGKWTSYRKMAEDAVTRAAEVGGLPPKPAATEMQGLHGAPKSGAPASGSPFTQYGTDAAALRLLIAQTPALGARLHPRLPYVAAEVIWAARHEMARTVEDVLSRRTRALQLDARAAVDSADLVAQLLAHELKRPAEWALLQAAEFREVASGCLP